MAEVKPRLMQMLKLFVQFSGKIGLSAGFICLSKSSNDLMDEWLMRWRMVHLKGVPKAQVKRKMAFSCPQCKIQIRGFVCYSGHSH